jgi:hypothetical protein
MSWTRINSWTRDRLADAFVDKGLDGSMPYSSLEAAVEVARESMRPLALDVIPSSVSSDPTEPDVINFRLTWLYAPGGPPSTQQLRVRKVGSGFEVLLVDSDPTP